MATYRYSIDWHVRRFGEVDSTNRWVLDQARAGAGEGLVAVAAHQTAGRGRRDRTWEAPAGTGLLVSVLLRPLDLPAERRHLCGFAMALAAADACAEVAGVRPALKWPNDLLVDDRKLAGVLSESAGTAVVVGLGLNLTWAPPGAVALAEVAGCAGPAGAASASAAGPAGAPSPDAVLDALLGRLDRWYGRWDDVASAHRRACATVGRTVRVQLDGEAAFTGVAADVTDAGHLLVDVGACFREVAAGDVVHLRDV